MDVKVTLQERSKGVLTESSKHSEEPPIKAPREKSEEDLMESTTKELPMDSKANTQGAKLESKETAKPSKKISFTENSEVNKRLSKISELLSTKNITSNTAEKKEVQKAVNQEVLELLETHGTEIRLVVIQDLNETDDNAPLNFYDQNGQSIFFLEDTNVDTLVVTTHAIERPLIFYQEHDEQFIIKLSVNIKVIFYSWNAANTVVVFYTSGNYFEISNHRGIFQFAYQEFILDVNAHLLDG